MLVIVLAVVTGGGGDDEPTVAGDNESPASGTSPQPAPTLTPLIVTAERLNADKEKNEVAWNDTYLDKQAQISGDISAIADAGGYYDVKLRSENPFMDVVCKINKSETSEALVTRLSAGQSVTILGRVTDDGIVDIVIKDCSIPLDGQVVALPAPDSAAEPAIADISAPSTAGEGGPILVTAEELSSEKASNEVAWNNRYLGKQAVISGEIALIEGAGSYYDVKLRGDDLFVHIVCKIRQSDAAKAEVLALSWAEYQCDWPGYRRRYC